MDLTRRKNRKWFWFVVVVAVVLVGVRVALPHWVTRYVNMRLSTMGDYHGRIQEVDLYLWRGAYSVRHLTIIKRDADIPVPLLEAPELELTVSWRALLKGRIVATATFYRPEVNFVDGSGEGRQSGLGVNWRQQLEGLAPFRLDTIQVHEGKVWFRNFDSDPVVDIQATQLEAIAQNLTNLGEQSERAASFDLTARLPGDAPVESQGRFDPFRFTRDFEYRIKITEFDLVRANEILQAYANVDVESGVGDFVMELESRDGQLNGYAKPLFRDVQIFSWKQDVEQQGDNPLRVAWEAFSSFIENLFKNQAEDQFATRVEISGTIDDAETSTLEAILAVLRNAFVEAFKPQFESLPAGENKKE